MFNVGTVVAQSTPYGYGGIGIVRLTGPDTVKILGDLTNRSKDELGFIKPRLAYRWIIFDENKEPFDDAVLTLFKGP